MAKLLNIKQNSPAEIRNYQVDYTEATGTIGQRSGTVHIAGASEGVALTFDYDNLVAGDELLIVNSSASYSGVVTAPDNATWDGTNTVATFPSGESALLVRAISSTRFYIIVNNDSVTFA